MQLVEGYLPQHCCDNNIICTNFEFSFEFTVDMVPDSLTRCNKMLTERERKGIEQAALMAHQGLHGDAYTYRVGAGYGGMGR